MAQQDDVDEGVDAEQWGCPNDGSALERKKATVGSVVGSYEIRIAKCPKCDYFEEVDD